MHEKLSTSQYRLAVQKLGLRSNHSVYEKSGMFYCYAHEEAKPSLSISFEKGIYRCFSCKDSGTINALCWKVAKRSIQDVLGLSEEEFLLFSKKPDRTPRVERTEADSHVDIRGAVVSFFDSPEALAYLKKRGIDLRIAESMEMQYTEEATINGKWYSKRLLIPIYGEDGHMVSVEGRDVTFEQQAKCLYPSGTIKSVYEWYKLDKKKPLYLFEGLIKMAVARSDPFFENSSAVYGTGLTPYQVSLLNKFDHVILVPDNDEPGKRFITELQRSLSCKFSTYQITDATLKDVDEIPTKKKISVKEFREKGGFIAQSLLSLSF